MKEMLVKVHKSHRIAVAICDCDVYGKVLEDGEKSLDMTTGFFNGEKVDANDLRNIMISYAKEDATFNIVGNESVRIAKECGIVKDDGVMLIGDVPMALILL